MGSMAEQLRKIRKSNEGKAYSRPSKSKAGEAEGVKYSEKAKKATRDFNARAAAQDASRSAQEKRRKKRRRKEIESQGYRKMN